MAEDGCRLARAYGQLGRRLTSACTRPATRVISCSAQVVGGRVMRGVRRQDGERRRISYQYGLRVTYCASGGFLRGLDAA